MTIFSLLLLNLTCLILWTNQPFIGNDSDSMALRVGWIGLGVMGSSMCSHIIRAGFPTVVFSRTQAKAQPLLDLVRRNQSPLVDWLLSSSLLNVTNTKGAKWAASASDVAAQSDVVFSIVGFPSDVKAVFEGVLASMQPGVLLGVLVDIIIDIIIIITL